MKHFRILHRPVPGPWLPWLAGGLVAGTVGAPAADPVASDGIQHLRELSLEELLDLEVSTVSKKEHRVGDSPAAISVLTEEDIRRSGVTHIAEALRLVPGVQVARLDANHWAISVRGFNEVFANKLLVMVDGRSVYTPLFSGTFWQFQDLSLESVERVEVVRGPGASVWGANAVNGVINIITKSARDSQGGHFSAGGGNFDEFLTTLGYGTAIADAAWLRFDGQFRDLGQLEDATGEGNGDDGLVGTGRFRLDWEPDDTAEFTLIGGGQYSEFSERVELMDLSLPGYVRTDTRVPAWNAHILGRWQRTVDERSAVEVQTYLDFSALDAPWIMEDRLNFDLEFNHRWQPGERHDFNWGIGYRLSADEIATSGDTIRFAEASRSVNLFSGYVQDEVQIVPEVLSVTAGVRLEHNEYTGFEVQPTLRGLWKLAEQHTAWGSISRAVRTPSRAENDATISVGLAPPGVYDPTLPALISYYGSPAFDSEEVLAFELGYRWQAGERLHFDLASFFNIYEQLRGSQAGVPYLNDPLSPDYLVIPVAAVNDTQGNGWGGEVSAVWQVAADWRVRLGYSYLELDLEGSDALDLSGWSPQHQAFLQSLFRLRENLELDAAVRYVGELTGPGIASYLTADVRLGWKLRENLELSVVGQNLFDSPHQEFQSSLIRYSPAYISRSVFGKVTWSF